MSANPPSGAAVSAATMEKDPKTIAIVSINAKIFLLFMLSSSLSESLVPIVITH
jgi:hypothetical protein